jgi:hypothetical protein
MRRVERESEKCCVLQGVNSYQGEHNECAHIFWGKFVLCTVAWVDPA